MKIVIVGAGEVGSYLAARLTRENHHVVVVEQDPERARHVEQHIDAHVVTGSGSHPDVMAAAGIDAADLLVAVTTDDEANLVACMLARQAGVEQSASPASRPPPCGRRRPRTCCGRQGPTRSSIPTRRPLSRSSTCWTTRAPARSTCSPTTRVTVIGTVLRPDSPLVGRPLSESFAPYGPDWEFLIGAVSRGDRTVIPRRDMVLQSGDVVRIVDLGTSSNDLRRLLGLAHDKRANRVMLLGGGRTGEMVAARLVEMHAEVCLVERDS